jgi:hypothetical protein
MDNNSNLCAQRNQRESPLLRLPAELRNEIYELVFRGQRVRINNITQDDFGEAVKTTKVWKSPLALLAACRQIKFEAFPIAYKSCTFDLRPFPNPGVGSMAKNFHLMQRIILRKFAVQLACIAQVQVGSSTSTSKSFPVLRTVELRSYSGPLPITPYKAAVAMMMTEDLRTYFERPHLEVEEIQVSTEGIEEESGEAPADT